MRLLNKLAPHTHWLIRLSLAGTFLYHGFGKFPSAQTLSDMLGISLYLVYIVALLETTGGIFIIIGGFGKEIFTRLGALFFAIVMSGAIIKFHWGQWSFVQSSTHPMGGMEFQTLILTVSIFFLCQGNAVGGKKSSM